MSLRLLAITIASTALLAQGRFPLESVSVEGSQISRDVILAISGLRIGTPVDKNDIEASCKKLEDAGLFESISYHYAPGPKHGYAVTLVLADQQKMVAAAIDLPGVDEEKTWQWLLTRFPAYDHRVPAAETAQQFLATQIEQQTRDRLRGQHIAVRLESDLGPPPKNLISFQPEVLPHVTSMTFTGQHEFAEADFVDILQKIMAQQGYLDRTFRNYVDLNLRPLYERHGMYRVRFPSITAKIEGDSVAVNTTVEEGSKYTLGDVQLTGDNLPVSEMLDAADFKSGRLANWALILSSIEESEKCLKRAGYMLASARPERLFDDDKHVLSLRIAYNKGPLFRLGEVKFTGLDPNRVATAKSVWIAQSGQPFDYTYPRTFLKAFFQKVDFRSFKKYSEKTEMRKTEPVVDVTMVFESK